MISILISTCNRPGLLREMLKSLRETTQKHEIEIIAVIDGDNESNVIAELYNVDVVDYSVEKRGALSCWNKALRLSDGEILVPAGDDQIFHPDWLDFALESHKEKLQGYGVVGMNDLAYDGNSQLATMYLMDRRYCKNEMGGVLCPPVYNYFCVDSEINAKARILGRFYWDERAKVEHLHSAHGKRPVDELDEEKRKWMEVDNKIFEERKSQGFPIVWDSMI